MEHLDIGELFDRPELIGQKVTVCGWVRTARDSKNVAFIELNDGTSLRHLQVVLDKSGALEIDPVMKLGAAVRVIGTAVEGRQGVPEINAEEDAGG